MTLTAVQANMLDALRKLGPSTAGELGQELWCPSNSIRTENTCATAWARPAGAVLAKLREKGLVREVTSCPRRLWDLVY